MWRPTQVDHARLGLRDAEVTHHRGFMAAVDAHRCNLPTHSRLRWRGQLARLLLSSLRRGEAAKQTEMFLVCYDLVELVRDARLEAIIAGGEDRDAVCLASHMHVRCAHPSRPRIGHAGRARGSQRCRARCWYVLAPGAGSRGALFAEFAATMHFAARRGWLLFHPHSFFSGSLGSESTLPGRSLKTEEEASAPEDRGRLGSSCGTSRCSPCCWRPLRGTRRPAG